ncbi:MAG: hypothetical protein IJA10_03590 [Lachnospiraceae bacterium]|nr:hypothetical protein [Lachnospiraceae bacterium]
MSNQHKNPTILISSLACMSLPQTPLSSIQARIPFLLSVVRNVILQLPSMTRTILYIYTG